MRATVNIEFGSDEIEGFVTNVIVKSAAGVLGDIAGDPAAVQGVLAGMQQMIGMVLHTATMHQHGPPRGRVGYPMGYPPPYAQTGPVPSTGPVPGPHGNVRPITESPTVEHCFPIDETSQNEASWGCCRCAIPNGLSRTHCRRCGHLRCGPVVTPAPVGPPPQALPIDPEEPERG